MWYLEESNPEGLKRMMVCRAWGREGGRVMAEKFRDKKDHPLNIPRSMCSFMNM